MTVYSDCLPTSETKSDSIAWLRLIEEKPGEGDFAVLFQTSNTGEPLGFCFTRIDHQPSDVKRARFRQGTLLTVVSTLLRASTISPRLILSFANEIPKESLNETDLGSVPICSIRTDDSAIQVGDLRSEYSKERFTIHWLTDLPDQETDVNRLLCEVLEWANPLEPFERTAAGLSVALADRRVATISDLQGLAVNISLLPLSVLHRNPDNVKSTVGDFAHDPDGLSATNMTLAERLWAVLARPPTVGHDVQLKWISNLMPFQERGVQALLESRRLLLADDMGLGKTVQAIAALRIMRIRHEMKSCMVVAPASLLNQWRLEIERWAPELTAIIIRGSATDRAWQWRAEKEVILVSYETLRSDFGGTEHSLLYRKNWDVVIADEAQRIKNRNDTSIALKGMTRKRSWALTGTPLENDEEELASIMEFVDHSKDGLTVRYSPGSELRYRHQELQLRRKKGDVLKDLPPKLIAKIPIELNTEQRRSYDRAEMEGIVYLRSLGKEISIPHVLGLITRLKQICNADPRTGESSKLADIKERLYQLSFQGHKALVYSQYVHETYGVAAAAEYLEEFTPLTITGDVDQHDRTEIIERFKNDPMHKVLILSLRAGGLGLNLQEASYVFHLDRWWNPAVERQAEDRSHRIGQTVKVNVIKYYCTGTIEERIDAILATKQELFDQLIDDVSLDLSTQLNQEELYGLFGLERPSENGK